MHLVSPPQTKAKSGAAQALAGSKTDTEINKSQKFLLVALQWQEPLVM
jgi:hypothetical protein